MGLSDRPAMIAQGKWDGGGSRRMMEKSFLSPMERSIILTLRERGRGREKERGEFGLFFLPKVNSYIHCKSFKVITDKNMYDSIV